METTKCPECRGSGRETTAEEVYDAAGLEVIEEKDSDYGPCEICNGEGELPPETPAQRCARKERERAEYRARCAREAAEHQATCPGARCWAPYRYHRTDW